MMMEKLTEEERRALRGSKFAPLPSSSSSSSSSSRSIPRLAHPGGPVTTNKAAALAKFLERKLQEPNGLASIDPQILEVAVKNAKATVNASGSTQSGRVVRHVDSFPETEGLSDDEDDINLKKDQKKKKEKKKKKKNKGKNKKLKSSNDPADSVVKNRKKIKL